jgi:uncharacterized protein YhjY with autotransporter beta-barrel domain
VDRVADSSPVGPATEVWLDARFNAPLGSWDAEPKAGLRSAWFHVGEWREAGADSLSLSAPAYTTRSVQADAGLRVSRAVGRVRPSFEGMYRRELTSDGTRVTLQLADLPGGTFDVTGLDFTRDEVSAQGGVTFLMNRFGLSVFYDLQYAQLQTRHSLQLGVGF